MPSTKLNSNQQKAVTYTEGPLLILAGPGSGKTFTITEKVVDLTENGLSPEKILALTFSEKAAGEMQERIESKIGVGSGITVSTFHSFCNDLIRKFSLNLGINQNAKLISKEHSHVWGIKNIDSFGFQNLAIPSKPYDLITSLLEGVSQLKDHLVSPEELAKYAGRKLEDASIEEGKRDVLLKMSDLARFYEHYQQYKSDNGFLDYDDMISMACNLLETNDVVRNMVKARYDYVLVDEFQDTNFAQLFLVHLIADGNNLTCVADDDQCIYRFRGAYLANIEQLQEYYHTLEKIPLEKNYRSSSQIVQLSQQLIANNPQRQEKNLTAHNGEKSEVKVVKAPDDVSEAEWVAEEITDMINEGVRPGEIFILTRKRADGKKFSESLKQRMVPVEFVGSLQLNRFPVVREAMAYLRVVADPFNNGIAFAKILSREGVSEHNLQKINLQALKISRDDRDTGDGIYSVLLYHLDELDISQKDLIRSIVSRLNELIEYKKSNLPSDTVKHLLSEKTDFYRTQLQEDTQASRRNISILNSLVTTVEDLELVDGGSELETVVEDLELVFGLDLDEGVSSDEDTVKVMTIHQSKGKEAKVVFVCDMATRHLPLNYRRKAFTVPKELSKGRQRDVDEKVLHLEEERRLAYVAMTRAKEELYLVFPEKYEGNKRKVSPSEFLTQLEYTSNPLVGYIEAEQFERKSEVEDVSPLMKKKDEYLRMLGMYSKQGQLKQALESLVVLAQLREIEAEGNLTAFDAKDFLQVNPKQPQELEDLIDNNIPPLVDPNMRFSASKIKTYQDCPLKFKYGTVLNIPTPQKAYFQVGTDVHSVYEQLSQMDMKGESIDITTANQLLDDIWDPAAYPSRTQEQQEHGKMKQMLDFWFRFEADNPNETVAVEEFFDLDLNGAHFGGVIDRVDRTPEGEYIVIDYKTGKTTLPKSKLKDDVQLALYCLAVKEMYGKMPVQAGLLYVNPDVQELRMMDVDEERIGIVVDSINAVVERVLKDDFEVDGEPNCYFCDFKGICEWGEGE
ncbi:ATP-dependent DNA helicase [Methanococcoides methylutens]|uniref:DNA 3'-5' helicase n=1 Tax=Methanococcoides methylutens MM1 TaxID=1434104 RepID=A0A0E3SS92_METMT|nr:ATP-dependent DNA helicase [Methanococcoides methylutens]AKB85353.1 ATP-dependent DNA helicase UvrD/PcrA [Methanococcoides methylutens MM1]